MAAGLLWLISGPPAQAARIEYLYINASEGSASGGHVALKIDDDVFHFQHIAPGLLRLTRDDADDFRLQYSGRENRTIRFHRIDVSDDFRNRLRDRLKRILLIETEQFDRLNALLEDRRLLEILLGQRHETVAVKGVGLFLPEGWQYVPISFNPSMQIPPNPPFAKEGNQNKNCCHSVAHLAQRLTAQFGADFFDVKARELYQQLQNLRPDRDDKPIALAEDRFQPADYSFAEQYTNHLAALAALQVLAQGLSLREGILLQPRSAMFRLSDAEKEHLLAYRTQLETQLSALPQGSLADWGNTLLVGMARLMALDQSIQSGYWAVLNLIETPDSVDETANGEAPAYLYRLAQTRFQQSRAEWTAAAFDEWSYLHMEQAANQLFASEQALSQGKRPLLRLRATPSRVAQVQPIPIGTPNEWQAALDRLDRYTQTYTDALNKLYAYDVLSRNCVSEIFRVVDAVNQATKLKYSSEVAIPFIAFETVAQQWSVTATDSWPAYRQRRIEQAKTHENPLLVDLRESNVLSSQIYDWHGGDAAFVFFTDDVVWARPVAGGFNLAAGITQLAAGLFSWPWDHGANLYQGAKGAFVSLPELLFFNIRKGSFPGLQSLDRVSSTE
jgi:hypothetical protein